MLSSRRCRVTDEWTMLFDDSWPCFVYDVWPYVYIHASINNLEMLTMSIVHLKTQWFKESQLQCFWIGGCQSRSIRMTRTSNDIAMHAGAPKKAQHKAAFHDLDPMRNPLPPLAKATSCKLWHVAIYSSTGSTNSTTSTGSTNISSSTGINTSTTSTTYEY
jgi:hypothetical protein